MEPDDELCLCFHVTRRKVVNFVRVERPRRASQLAECFGAGTGCGWCRPFLERIYEQANADTPQRADLPSSQEYAQQRGEYIQETGAQPAPGATPPPEIE